VHDDYISTFGGYLNYLSKPDFDINVFINDVHHDSMNSSASRGDVINYISALKSSVRINNRMEKYMFEEFIDSMENYFFLPEYLPFAFNRIGENEWLIIVAGSGAIYNNHPSIWRVSKDNVDAINLLYKKALENNKSKVYISDHIPEHISKNRDDFHFMKISKRNRYADIEEQRILDWCETIYEATTDPYSNAPRVAVLSFLSLNNNTKSDITTKLLKNIIRLLQENYNDISRNYYSLRIELLG
jgi:hypothetical protein